MLVPQTKFRRQTSGDVSKFRLFSQASKSLYKPFFKPLKRFLELVSLPVEKLCHIVSSSFSREVTVDSARHRCTEGLFKPSVWGKDNPGIHELTVKAIMACGIDMRKQMCRNIYLSGGGSMSPGLFSKVYHN